KTAMACLGTALTETHAKEISRVSSKVILCLDGDNAGINATLKALPILRSQGLEVKVAKIVGGKDPDEVIKVCGVEAMEQIINDAMDSVEFELRQLASNYDLETVADRTKFVSGAFKILSIFKTYSEKEIYVPIVAELSKLSPTVIRADLNKNTKDIESKIDNNTQDIENNFSTDALMKAQQFILASLINDKSYAKLEDGFDLCLKDNALIKLYEYIIDKKAKNEKINIASIFDFFEEDEIKGVITDIISYDLDSFGENAELYFKNCVHKIKLKQLEIELDSLSKALKSETDAVRRMEYAKKVNDVIGKITKTKAEDING
ncbi:MAG: toprim domain-containing protein, partial [Christensenellales bacterium]